MCKSNSNGCLKTLFVKASAFYFQPHFYNSSAPTAISLFSTLASSFMAATDYAGEEGDEQATHLKRSEDCQQEEESDETTGESEVKKAVPPKVIERIIRDGIGFYQINGMENYVAKKLNSKILVINSHIRASII